MTGCLPVASPMTQSVFKKHWLLVDFPVISGHPVRSGRRKQPSAPMAKVAEVFDSI